MVYYTVKHIFHGKIDFIDFDFIQHLCGIFVLIMWQKKLFIQ